MNTRTQILPLWAPSKDWALTDPEIFEVTTCASSSLVVDGNVAYHLTHNVGKSQNKPRTGANTRIWTLLGSVPPDRPTVGLYAHSHPISIFSASAQQK
jgi:hypothetical protein